MYRLGAFAAGLRGVWVLVCVATLLGISVVGCLGCFVVDEAWLGLRVPGGEVVGWVVVVDLEGLADEYCVVGEFNVADVVDEV